MGFRNTSPDPVVFFISSRRFNTSICQLSTLIITVCVFFATLSAIAQQPGKLFDTVICRLNSAEKYALYLPDTFDPGREYQLLLFLDPGGRALIPLKNYSLLADRYNLIFGCSYNSKNGPTEPSVKAVYAMLDDLTTRYKIDKSSVLLSGFSGGARVATLLGIYDKSIGGIIACGAAFPQREKILRGRNLPYALVTGNRDMNYLETLEALDYLEKIQNPAVRFEFDDGHQWPPVDVFEKALLWHLMRKGTFATDEVKRHYDADMSAAILVAGGGEALKAHLLFSQIKSQYEAYEIMRFSDSLSNRVRATASYQSQRKRFDGILTKERDLTDRFFNSFVKALATSRPDTAFQKNQWSGFQKIFSRLKESAELDERNLGERLVNVTTMSVAERARAELETSSVEKALLCAKIWNAIDPSSPWALFTLSKIYAQKSDTRQAIDNLEKAIEKGFKEKNRIAADPVFNNLRSNSKFTALLDKL